MAWVGRKYKLDSSENFDEYMQALGQYSFHIMSCHLLNSLNRMSFFYIHTRRRSSSSQSWSIRSSYMLFRTTRRWVPLLQRIHIQEFLHHIQTRRREGTRNRWWSQSVNHIHIGWKHSNSSGKMQEELGNCSCIFRNRNGCYIDIWRCNL